MCPWRSVDCDAPGPLLRLRAAQENHLRSMLWSMAGFDLTRMMLYLFEIETICFHPHA
jgi:hypothetical protein